jgi:nucleoside-diphosphate-sugar epimerase
MTSLEGKRILITGPAGQVAFPIARALARANEVIGVSRFGRAADRERLEAFGVRCISADLSADALDGVPQDVDVVLHFAVAKSRSNDFEGDLDANGGGTARLMAHCRGARAFVHCSSTGVYQPAGHHPLRESDPLGDNHRAILPTYSLAKIAAETMARFAARQWGIPTTIARLNVPYGDNGGWPAIHLEWMIAGQPVPVHPDKPNLFNPLHEDDSLAHIPRLIDIASVPATTVNWGGSEAASIEEWCAYLGELTGKEPRLLYTDKTISSVTIDLERMHALLGPTRVPWREGMRRMVAARHPELLREAADAAR